jgi:hypothetical protein
MLPARRRACPRSDSVRFGPQRKRKRSARSCAFYPEDWSAVGSYLVVEDANINGHSRLMNSLPGGPPGEAASRIPPRKVRIRFVATTNLCYFFWRPTLLSISFHQWLRRER